MINKKAFFFWEGEVMSWLRYMTLYSFVKYHPDWECELYLSNKPAKFAKSWNTLEVQDDHDKLKTNYIDDVKYLDIEIKEYDFKEPIHPVKKSDIFQWDILSKNSGVYFDMDIVFIKNIDPLWETFKDCDSAISYFNYKGHTYFSIGMVASNGNNYLFESLYKKSISLMDDSFGYQGCGKVTVESLIAQLAQEGSKRSNPFAMLEECYDQNIFNLDNVIYPFQWDEDAARFYDVHSDIDQGHFGIHWFGGRPVSQVFNEMLNEDNFRKHANSVCYFIDKAYSL